MRRFAVPVLALLLLLSSTAPHAASAVVDTTAVWTINPSTSGRVNARTRVLWANGSATAFLTIREPSTRLSFSARVVPCEGPARVEVRVDGLHLATHEVAGDGRYQVPGNWAAGRHHVSFRFTNDLQTGSCDRNLVVSDVYFRDAYGVVGGKAPTYQAMLMTTATVSPVTAGRLLPTASWNSNLSPMLWGNGTARGVLDSQAAELLALDLQMWPCNGQGPAVAVRVDGVEVHREPAAWSYFAETRTVRAEGPFTDGVHVVEVEYLNDLRTATCDRGVMVTSAEFFGRV